MEERINNLQWKIGGEAGFGIKVTGQMFSRMCSRGGLRVFDYTEYPSLIRGGHNTFQVVVRDRDVFAPRADVDLLVALNQETIIAHVDELAPRAGVMYDPDDTTIDVSSLKERGVQLFPVPFVRLAREAGGDLLMRNVVALAASVGLLNYDLALLESVIHTAFDRKGEAIVRKNLGVARAGFSYADEKLAAHFPHRLQAVSGQPSRMVVTGNTAVALGAIAAGCTYFAGYPMTPATAILSTLAKNAATTGMVVRHDADEIAAINSAIGAGYAGARAMTATSGGGFSLMVEALGLAGMTEVPLVIVDAQRPGPATGLPTWTGQGDLQFVLHAAQDEFPRILIAPGDVTECFYATANAFNLAERYQLPVFILTDKFLGESHATVEPFDTASIIHDRGEVVRHPTADANGQFPRYAVTGNGVSPRTLPGTPDGTHVANSDEHDQYGNAEESAANRIAMHEKRLRKLASALADIPLPTLSGPKEADLTLIGWGSTKGPLLAALEQLSAEGASVNVLHFVYLYPLPAQKLASVLRACKRTVVVEGNAQGQLNQLLKTEVGLLADDVLHKYDGRPFFPEEIVAKVHALLAP